MAGAAGWYDDPGGSGDQRWWDGTVWTQHRRLRPRTVLELTPDERRRKNRRTWAWVLGLGAAFVAMAALATAMGSSETSGGRSRLDALGRQACYNAYKLGQDADLLTDVEIRERVKDIYDDARYSGVPGLAPSARRLLAAATAVDVDDFAAAVSDFANACNPPATTDG